MTQLQFWFGLLTVSHTVSQAVRQDLTWEVRLCPGAGAVCLTSVVSVPRRHHQIQTAAHCDLLCLCLCCFSQFSAAVGRENHL